ncbi:MAG: hypothetical protein ACRD16_04125 [Thermoanaerobaculia bacterium]
MTLKGVQFVETPEGQKTGVLIDLRRHRQVWEDLYDTLVAESRRHEPRSSLDLVKKRLGAARKRRA